MLSILRDGEVLSRLFFALKFIEYLQQESESFLSASVYLIIANRSTGRRPRAKRVYNLSTRTARGLRQLQILMTHLSFFLSFFEYIAWFFCQWLHGAFCVSMKVFDRWITSNFVQMTPNNKHKKLLEILAGEDFPSKLLWRTPTKIHRKRKRRRQQETAKQREHRLAQRRQRRQHSDHNMYRGSDKILQLHCKWNWWKKGKPTVDASKSDEEIRQRLQSKLSSSMQR